jgi:hypothetical protein
VGWEGVLEALPSCGVLGVIVGFLVFLLRRETADRDYWRSKAMDALGLGQEVAKVAKDLVE